MPSSKQARQRRQRQPQSVAANRPAIHSNSRGERDDGSDPYLQGVPSSRSGGVRKKYPLCVFTCQERELEAVFRQRSKDSSGPRQASREGPKILGARDWR
jgi:hypothetical protein